MTVEPFSIEELNAVVADRLRKYQGRPHRPETVREMVSDVASGLKFALRTGYAQPLLVCGRLRGNHTADFWVGPEWDPRRPGWTREEETVSEQT